MIKKYYKQLKSYFVDRPAHSKTDDAVYVKNKEKLDTLAPYLEQYLLKAWETYFAYSNDAPDFIIKYPYLGAFVQSGLMDKMYRNLNTFRFEMNHKKKKYLMHYLDIMKTIVKDDDKYEFMFDGVDFEFYYKGMDPKLCESFPKTTKEQAILADHYYDMVFDEMGDEDFWVFI